MSAALAPMLCVGVPLAVAAPWQQLQPELLASCLVFCAEYCRGGVAAGVAAGCVLGLKLVLAPPLVVACWLRLRRAWRGGRLARELVGLVAGVALVWLPAAALAWRAGLLAELWRTRVVTPPPLLAELPQTTGFESLVAGVSWFARHFAPLLALGVAARAGRPTRRPVAWLAVGLLVVLI